MPVPSNIELYHIVHIDRLPSIISDGFLWSDAEVRQRSSPGTNIGIDKIKDRRLRNTLSSYSDLHVGECVPFYFCPRSVMLYLFYKGNHSSITYTDGQERIVHLVVDLNAVIHFASRESKRWVFTDSNAGSYYFNDFNDLQKLDQIDWAAVQAIHWADRREKKQAEFLIESRLPFDLIESIGVYSNREGETVRRMLRSSPHRPPVSVKREWYY